MFSSAQEFTPEAIFEKVNPTVVTIFVQDFNGKVSTQGSGVVFNDDGWIVTNYHVFAGGEKIIIKHENRVISYTNIIGVDVEKDILILKMEDKSFPSLPIADSDKLKVGQKVYAIGSPLGYENTLSEGIISGLRSSEGREKNFIQMTAPISAGSSGGAVVNSHGELIGISTQTIRGGQNLNFAISINDVLKVRMENYSDPKQLEAFTYFYRGISALDENNDYESGIKNFYHAIELNPNQDEFYDNLATCYFYLGEQDSALKYFQTALSFDSLNSNYHNAIGVVYVNKEEWGQAILCFRKTISLDSNRTVAYLNLGACYFLTNELDSAISVYRKILDKDPLYVNAYVNLGTAYDMKKMYEASLENYKKALEMEPDSASHYYNVGATYLDLGKYREAINYLATAVRKKPVAQYYYRLGQAYFMNDDFPSCIENLKKAIDKEPEEGHYHLLLSAAYKMTGEKKLAILHKKKAYELNPELRNNSDEREEYTVMIKRKKYGQR